MKLSNWALSNEIEEGNVYFCKFSELMYTVYALYGYMYEYVRRSYMYNIQSTQLLVEFATLRSSVLWTREGIPFVWYNTKIHMWGARHRRLVSDLKAEGERHLFNSVRLKNFLKNWARGEISRSSTRISWSSSWSSSSPNSAQFGISTALRVLDLNP